MQEKRVAWRADQAQWNAQSLVFIDETGANTKMTRCYARSLRGRRVIDKVPYGHWKTTTFLGALRVDGLTAPLVVDGPMNGPLFRAYVEQHLAPTLRAGDIVILDNLPAHRWRACERPLKRSAPDWLICHLTARTSTPSSNGSPNSKRC